MKSFSQFLNESYMNEGVSPNERPARRRSSGPSPEEVKAQIDAREAEKAQRRAQRKPSGAAARPDLQFKKSTVQSPATPKPTTSLSKPQTSVKVDDVTNPRRAAADNKLRRAAAGTGPSGKPIITPPPSGGKPSTPSTPSSSTTTWRPGGENVKRTFPKPASTPSTPSTPSPSGGKPPSGTPGEIKPTTTKGKFPSGLGRNLGRAAYGLEAGLETMDQKARGRKTGSAIAMGATKTAGGWAGMKAGVAAGGKLGSVLGPKGAAVGALVGGTAGYLAGSGIAKKASETVAGATGKEKTAMATANRQRQAGTAIKGIGGKTTFDTKKNTMTTGTGSQRKTVQLAKTGVVQRGGQSVAGHLAYKGGKAVYKAGPSAQSLAKTSSNPLERIGRSLFAGAYKKHDAAKAQQALTKSRQSDAARQKALGVKALPGK
jgi:hypothetical protein